MMSTLFFIAFVFTVYAAAEYYGWQAAKSTFALNNYAWGKWAYWSISLFFFLMFLTYRPFLYKILPKELGVYLSTIFMILLLSKLIIVLFLLPEDIWRAFRFMAAKWGNNPDTSGSAISRSEFISKAAMAVAAVPAGSLIYGVAVNAYNYQFRKNTITLPNLPEAFNGFRIVQLSDIHSGSFTRKEPVEKVIRQINALKPDLILFTGDLVNNVADEMDSWADVFSKLEAKHGVYSVLGNHDYGDYVEWGSAAEKQANFEKFKGVHAAMGWNLLLNEHRFIEKEGEKIALLGMENWGKGRFAKYGDIDATYAGCEEAPVKILMSHDPSSWDEKILPFYKDIDLTLSGHTHGAQFGVENKWLRWSPSQYIYKQWAGLYQQGAQYLYVNRGFGFLGYPGRVGILPEVAVLTLHKA